MAKLKIDGNEVEVKEGSTILEAARKLGITIPTLCFDNRFEPSTSCMVCAVKLGNSFVPSCATIAQDGMEVESDTEEVAEARKMALELLLSDHIGDCSAPCSITCPAGLNIPVMIRQIAAGVVKDAIATVKKDIALPAVLGRICSAPCEKACRRGTYDNPVSIRLLERYVADADLASESPYVPVLGPPNGKKVAIIGTGPTGLAAAFYLLQEGYSCVLYDDNGQPGGMLRYGVSQDQLPREILDAEVGIIEKLGAVFQLETRIGRDLSITDLQSRYHAILIATGSEMGELGVQLKADKRTLQTDMDGIFAGGNALGRRGKMAVRSVADGKLAANSIHQYLSGHPITGRKRRFSVHMGRVSDEEVRQFMVGVTKKDRTQPQNQFCGFSEAEARSEARRCLHCDCRKADDCRLRDYSERYGADPHRFLHERKSFERYFQPKEEHGGRMVLG